MPGLCNLWTGDLYATGMLYFFPTVTLYCHKLLNRQGYVSGSRLSGKIWEQMEAGKGTQGRGA